MLGFALAFLLGDVWVQFMPALTLHAFIPPIGLAGLSLLLLRLLRWRAGPVIVAFLLGLVWTAMHARALLQQDLAPALEGDDHLISGYIASIPEVESYGVRFEFVVSHADVTLPERMQLSWYQPVPVIHAGQRWQLLVRLKRRHGYANPGGYDYEAQLFRQGLGATGYIRTSEHNQLLGMVSGEWVLKARAALTEAIAHAIPRAPMQGVIRGLAVGDQQAISSAAWQVFARTGTSHLMAISGFHIGMVAWLFAWLGSRLIYWPSAQQRRWTVPDLRALFGMSAALLYSLLAGMSVPTQRTLIMLAVYFGATVLRREVNVWHSFGLALLLVLLIDPFAPLAVGSWLSFGAVTVILLNQSGRLNPVRGWRQFLVVQGAVTLGLVPLLLSAFGGLSLISPLVNLLAIPLFTAVLVPLVLLACGLLMLWPGVGTAMLGWLAQLLDWVFAGLQWCAGIEWSNWYAPQAPIWSMALLLLGTVMLVLPWSGLLRLSGLLCCLPALCWRAPLLPEGSFTLTTLDVGQGLALVLQTRHHTLLYDTGPRFQSGRDTGELVVLPYLRSIGVRQLDLLMASHGDDDHVGGMQTVLAGMPVRQLLTGPSVPAYRPDERRCQRGQHWQWDGVRFEVLHPDAEQAGLSDNNLSCVVRIASVAGSVLLTGDAEKLVEQQLLSSDLIEPVALVVAGHHGSRSSSTPGFVTATRPRWVIFSAGYRNRWDFPRQEVVQRWQAAGAAPFSTIDGGAVTASFRTDRPVTVSRYRDQYPRYWRTR